MDFRTTLSNQLWGPALWKLLHLFAERIGTIPSHPSEKQLWIGLLNNLRYTLPCVLCRTHYSNYISTYAFPNMDRESVRRWLYELHSWVNEQLGKPNISYDDLESIYNQPISLSQELDLLSAQGVLAVRLRICSQAHVTEMMNLVVQLRNFYQL